MTASTSGSQHSLQTIHATTTTHTSASDTISFGLGQDTVFEQGQASVHGLFGGAGFATDASSGAATLLGGGFSNEFVTNSSKTLMQGGLRNLSETGLHDSLSGGSSSHVFDFLSKDAGQHVISNFVAGQDKLYLDGASFAQLQQSHEISSVGGNTIIKLDGGSTTIELKGVSDLGKSDITHKH